LAKPVVDRLEDELPQVPVVRINTSSPTGSELAAQFSVRGIPTLLVVDGAGQVVLRQVGRIERASVIEALNALADGSKEGE
jgi:thioredoxin-related protein